MELERARSGIQVIDLVFIVRIFYFGGSFVESVGVQRNVETVVASLPE